MTSDVTLPVSRDPQTGQVYAPPRKYAADGSLRECEHTTIAAKGTLASWTDYRDEFYGLLDLEHDVRIQALLGPGPHDVGSQYHGIADDSGAVRFIRD